MKHVPVVHCPSHSVVPARGAVIIVHHSSDHLAACLASLQRELPGPDVGVVVIDNASEARISETLSREFPFVHFLRSETNLGYAGGNNAGADYAASLGAPLVYLLNDDTEVTPRFWEACEAAILQRGAAIAGSLVVHLARPNTIQSVGMTIDFDNITETYHPTEHVLDESVARDLPFDIVYGAAMMMPTDVFQRHRGFDESFGHLFEDFDLCLRVRAAGGIVVCAGNSIVRHKGGGSLPKVSPRYARMFYRNRLWFWKRHTRRGTFWRYAPARIFRQLLNQCSGRDWLPGGFWNLAGAMVGIASGFVLPQPARREESEPAEQTVKRI